MDIVSRLKQFMDFTKLPSSQFADLAQIPRPTLSQIMNGRNKKISNELINKLHEAFPHLNVLWLMFGDGDMVIGENIEFSEGLNTQNLFDQTDESSKSQRIDDLSGEELDNSIFTQSTQNLQSDANQVSKSAINTQEHTTESNARAIPMPIVTDSSKKIASIMVFYTDNSYESFVPAESSN